MNAEFEKRKKDAERLNGLSKKIIGCAIEVHRTLGPGLIESLYEEALAWELCQAGFSVHCQKPVPVFYKGNLLSERLRLDLLVDDCVIIECKVKSELAASDKPQLLSYLRATGLSLGLLISFHENVLKNGLHRIVNNFPSADSATLAPPRS